MIGPRVFEGAERNGRVPGSMAMHRPKPFVWKTYQRIVIILLLSIALFALAVALTAAARMTWPSSERWFATAGLVSALAGLFQLDHSGFFNKFKEYRDVTKYPYGPPSYITREIIANPETPIRTRIISRLFFHPRTGFYLIVGGALLQLIATWL